MLLSETELRWRLDALAAAEPAFARGLAEAGYPAPRIREPGYGTMFRTIVGQQVSVAAAAAIWRRLEELLGADVPAASVLAADEAALRACGLSRQKISYARSLAALTLSGELDFDRLPKDDEEAIALLTRIRGVGRWTAEIYLLFAEGREDIWPAGDLVVQIQAGRLLGLEERPSEQLTRALAEPWRPHRGPAAIFLWHHYGASRAPV